ncbi:hypothetical protein AMIS_2620 [Actinoplanes missouriensis 431]|uniref:Uncharacterized protein n=1 Tax=Actinoplanes missouriensis (strain ATCC 14538 / DSM 43046 / CBS 188.64 / JCM 3121 / NBRC 102363 / NCIMB 12654 / NRRL B-3342 / UNCC 431) TaxID=512565 RepID=I0GXJ5_ACTM4|nr:hypothetical protein AMIS_2620 [Actinoplanes missouriensis 431]
MPSPRYTDHGPAARQCARCGTTHRTHDASGTKILCPPVNQWLISKTPLQLDPKGPQ